MRFPLPSALLLALLAFVFQPAQAQDDAFTLQVLHAADQEAGLAAVEDAVFFSAVIEALADDFDNTLRLSSGDLYIPGPFFQASDAVFGRAGVGDVLINNALGFQAVALGNHEFDFGPETVEALVEADSLAIDGVPGIGTYPGTAFPYLSTNLDFAPEPALSDLVVPGGQAPQPNALSSSVVIEVGGERVGIVGATTPILDVISSPGEVGVNPEVGGTFTDDEIPQLAQIIQQEVDALTAQGIDKVVLLAHMQQIAIEERLAELLTDVDVVIAGGSNTLLANADDPLRAGDVAAGPYPIEKTSASGERVVVVNTDGNYTYVGRLVVTFEGGLIQEVVDESGAYATDLDGVDRVYDQVVGSFEAAADLADPVVVAVAGAIRDNVLARDANLFGRSAVFLNGTRAFVRQQETNLGNLTAEANLAIARDYDPDVAVSLKNGGGIRDDIGRRVVPPGGSEVELLPTEANPLAGKEEGEISQLDIENTLRFNNALSLLTLSAADLLEVAEFAVAESDPALENTPGRFPQVAGLRFAFDPALPPGDRVESLALVDSLGAVTDVLVRDSELVGEASREVRIVTLNFLAGGGDGYPFPELGENRVDLVEEPVPPAVPNVAMFAEPGTEQDALAEYLALNFPADDDAATPVYAMEDEPIEEDVRIQNLAFRDDAVLPGGPVEDVTAPECELVSTEPLLRVRLRDGGSGLADVRVMQAKNATVNVPDFAVGFQRVIFVTAEKQDEAKRSTVVLEVEDVAGNVTTCDPVLTTVSTEVPETFALGQNYPNPFNPTTTIRFELAEAADVRLVVYDVMGREVARLVAEPMEAGTYAVEWEGADGAGRPLPSGLYLYRIEAGAFSQSRTMTLLK